MRVYDLYMQKLVEWSHEKNEWLKKHRDVCFEDVVAAIESGNLLATEKNSSRKYPHQHVYVVRTKDYIYTAPFVEDDQKIFLKTIFPSHQYAKRYL